MKIAICATFMEADLWQKRLVEAMPGEQLQFDEYYTVEALEASPTLSCYRLLWVALPGARGMEAIVRARERSGKLPIVWVDDDDRFGLIGYNLQVAAFLKRNSGEREISDALLWCKWKREA